MANNNTGFPNFPTMEWKSLYSGDIVQEDFNKGRIPSQDGSDIVIYHDDTFSQFYASSDIASDENIDEEDNLSIKVFVSKDGAKIRKLAMQKEQRILPSDHELLVFIEDNTGDKLTDPVCHLVAGRTAKAHIGLENVTANVIHELEIEQKDYFDLVFAAQKGQTDFLDELNLSVLKNILRENEGGAEASVKAWFRQLNPKRVISKLINKILGKFINFLKKYARVAEKRWNPNHKEYKGNLDKLYALLKQGVGKLSQKLAKYQSKINALIKKIEGVGNVVTKQAYNLLVSMRNILAVFAKLTDGFNVILTIKEEDILGTIRFYIGLIVGLWNGLMDLITGLLFLLQLMVKGLIGADQLAGEIASNPSGYLKLFLEYLDNIIQAFQSFSFEGVWEAIQKGFASLAEAIAKSLDNANAAQVGYFIGYLAFNILEFFVPITKIAKVRSVNDLFKAAAPLKTGIAKASGIAADAKDDFLKALERFIAFLRRGGEGLKQLIQDIFQGIRKWLDELSLRGFSRATLSKADELGLEIKLIERKLIPTLASGGYATSKELYAILDKHGRRIAAGSKDDLEKIFRNKITKVTKNLLKVDFGHYYIRKSKGNYTKVRSEGLIHIGDDGKSTFVLRGSADEVKEAITSGRKLFGKTGIIQLGRGKYSVLYEGREVFRNGETLARNLLDEINTIGGRIPDEWLTAFDDIYAFRTAYGAEPFNLLTTTGSNGAFAKLVNAGKEEIQGVSINLRRAITRSEKDVDLPLRENGYNLVKDYHPTKSKNNLPGFLTHAEATVLMKASQNGKITKKMAMFVDRKTCDLCLHKENGIVPLLKSMGVDEMLIYNGHTLKPIIIEKYLKDSDKAYKITRYIKGVKKIKVYRYK